MAYTTIDNPELYFQVKIWTGTGSSNALTLDGDEDMQPDYIAIKQRSSTQQWHVVNSVSGVQKYFGWNTYAGEETQSQGVTAFGSDGFTVGTDDMVNKSSSTYVAYCWKESATSGFDMVAYSGNGSARTISHSLSAVPGFILVKDRTNNIGNTNHNVYHSGNTAAPEPEIIALNETSATSDSSIYWNDTAPTSSVFSVGTAGQVNDASDTYLAKLWAPKQGFSKIGKYTGNGQDTPNGVFVYLGFTPAMILIKATDDNSWVIVNNKSPADSNPVDNSLAANDNAAETTGNSDTTFDFLSNGFRTNGNSGNNNSSGQDYIYMAFAEAPFVNSNGVPNNAR
jgi:hypothetical protein